MGVMYRCPDLPFCNRESHFLFQCLNDYSPHCCWQFDHLIVSEPIQFSEKFRHLESSKNRFDVLQINLRVRVRSTERRKTLENQFEMLPRFIYFILLPE